MVYPSPETVLNPVFVFTLGSGLMCLVMLVALLGFVALLSYRYPIRSAADSKIADTPVGRQRGRKIRRDVPSMHPVG